MCIVFTTTNIIVEINKKKYLPNSFFIHVLLFKNIEPRPFFLPFQNGVKVFQKTAKNEQSYKTKCIKVKKKVIKKYPSKIKSCEARCDGQNISSTHHKKKRQLFIVSHSGAEIK